MAQFHALTELILTEASYTEVEVDEDDGAFSLSVAAGKRIELQHSCSQGGDGDNGKNDDGDRDFSLLPQVGFACPCERSSRCRGCHCPWLGDSSSKATLLDGKAKTLHRYGVGKSVTATERKMHETLVARFFSREGWMQGSHHHCHTTAT